MAPASTEPDKIGDMNIAGKSDNPRKAYLRHIGFASDPFAQPVAEQEYGFAGQGTFETRTYESPETTTEKQPLKPNTNFFPPSKLFSPLSFYVDPLYADRREGSTFNELRADGHAFVLGQPGAGKSTLRLALEAHLRGQPDGTLAVTFEPGRECEMELAEAAKAHGQTGDKKAAAIRDAVLRALTQALTIDLFIQIVEQFGARDELPTPRQNRRLCNLITLAAPRLRAVMERLSTIQEPSSVWGFAELWRSLDRPIIRPVIRSEFMAKWLGQLRAQRKHVVRQTPSALELWDMALSVADMWGYRRVFLLLDGFDTWWREPDDMLRLLKPFLAMMGDFEDQQVSLKCFLTLEMKRSVTQPMPAGDSIRSPRLIVLAWSPERLQALLLERYRAGGSRRMSIADLVVPELQDRIDALLIEEAHGSPRRLLVLIHELIEAHIARGRLAEPITMADWQRAVMMADKRAPVIPIEQASTPGPIPALKKH